MFRGGAKRSTGVSRQRRQPRQPAQPQRNGHCPRILGPDVQSIVRCPANAARTGRSQVSFLCGFVERRAGAAPARAVRWMLSLVARPPASKHTLQSARPAATPSHHTPPFAPLPARMPLDIQTAACTPPGTMSSPAATPSTSPGPSFVSQISTSCQFAITLPPVSRVLDRSWHR